MTDERFGRIHRTRFGYAVNLYGHHGWSKVRGSKWRASLAGAQHLIRKWVTA